MHRTLVCWRSQRSLSGPPQVLRYLPGQKYDAHHDYFDPEMYKGQPHMIRMVENGRRNRLATLLWYMNDVPGGGGTHFPRAGGSSQPRSFLCSGNFGDVGCAERARQREGGIPPPPRHTLSEPHDSASTTP